MIRVLLVDDHSLFVSGLKTLLKVSGIAVVGMAKDGVEALLAVRELQPDVVLMDIQMSGCDGLTATRLIKAEFPDIKVVILTMIDEDQLVCEAIQSGASGFLLKNLEAEALLTMLEDVVKGEMVFSPGLTKRLLQGFVTSQNGKFPAGSVSGAKTGNPLTPRQKEVLIHIAHGQTYKEVAADLNISGNTVKYHMNEILERLHLENRVQAVAYAVQANLTVANEWEQN
ncbi:two-component system NarL family response regulator [Sporomusaceae bacterium BoRhaA]|uniref:response regulator n=1 Tax=Pelorhabdus rhamnosifermentans TaxID=2772457 RepID=UPI001C0641D0|nr:response regulator transcription factor [Pelorhabdus rhamnosifermentans]MBU2699058.1 two-component system NarL family response regulator [Pelorhabdus rhamnosifermentans]